MFMKYVYRLELQGRNGLVYINIEVLTWSDVSILAPTALYNYVDTVVKVFSDV